MHVFSKVTIGAIEFGPERYRKKVPIQATRIVGPFMVETSEGPLTCQDGWLCLDARGYPYPVAADEFELIYELDDSTLEE